MGDYLIGCDPEVFVRNPNSQQFLCAHNMVQGTKAEPFKVKSGAVQVDGMALEFNIDPAHTRDEFVNNVTDVYHELARMVPGYELVAQPSAHFEPEVFAAAPAESKVLGCDPDFNAWTGIRNDPPQGDRPFRTAAGHVHIGWTQGVDPLDEVHFADCIAVTKQLDYALGLNSLLYDKDNERRLLYGKAGAFRPKPYGVEYRVLSNAWLQSPELIGWVYDATQKALELLEKGRSFETMYGNVARDYIDRGQYPGQYAPGIPAPPVRDARSPFIKAA